MKVLLSVLFVNCVCICSCLRDDGQITELLTKNTKELTEANNLLTSINTVGKRIQVNLEEQQKALQVLGHVEQILAKQNEFLEAQAEALLETFANNSRQGHEYAKRTAKELHDLAQLQEGTQHLILHLEAKIDAYQKHLVQSARGIDRSIDGLSKLVTRAVLPQLNGLQCSFASLETSQINIEVELKSLAGVKELSVDSNQKLGVLDHQLKQFNRTQEARLEALTSAVRHLRPLNTREHIEAALRELIISQKRIEVDLEDCGKHSHHSQHSPRPESHSQGYRPADPHHPHHAPQPESHSHGYGAPAPQHPHHPHHGSQQEPHLQSYGNSAPQPHHPHQQQYQQTRSKPVDLVQVWSIKEPQKPGEHPENHRVSAYAESPEPKAKHASWSNSRPNGESESHQSTSVSWQHLPWEEVSPYQSAPSPNHPWNPESPHQPLPRPQPQPRTQPKQKPCEEGRSNGYISSSPHSYKPQQSSGSAHDHIAQQGESFRIWYGDDSIKERY
ncbi:class E vacuolar protein-sorting machinery protein HSE1 [Drosophila obscura]|uniref:class E vacuolar protein-sorting machinery protein HSE1 n=1 Tax=Drosophila obscura TaxID=7282 RepID=UPI000B9FB0CE|nr:class E vacuolar protein-sorting machinery protein HSE1 [Drosophila obscura]